MNAMRKVFRRRRASLTFGPCITSLIHSSPASRKAKRRRSVATGSPGRLSSRPSRESSRCTVEGARGWSTPRSRAMAMRALTERAGCSVLSATSSSATSGGRFRGRPRSARVFGYTLEPAGAKPWLSQSRIVSGQRGRHCNGGSPSPGATVYRSPGVRPHALVRRAPLHHGLDQRFAAEPIVVRPSGCKNGDSARRIAARVEEFGEVKRHGQPDGHPVRIRRHLQGGTRTYLGDAPGKVFGEQPDDDAQDVMDETHPALDPAHRARELDRIAAQLIGRGGQTRSLLAWANACSTSSNSPEIPPNRGEHADPTHENRACREIAPPPGRSVPPRAASNAPSRSASPARGRGERAYAPAGPKAPATTAVRGRVLRTEHRRYGPCGQGLDKCSALAHPFRTLGALAPASSPLLQQPFMTRRNRLQPAT